MAGSLDSFVQMHAFFNNGNAGFVVDLPLTDFGGKGTD